MSFTHGSQVPFLVAGENPCKDRGPPQAASEAMQLFIEMGGRKGFAEQSLAVKVKVPWDGWDGDVFWAG